MSSKARREKRNRLVYAQKGLCFYCERPFTSIHGARYATLDHVIAMSAGGSPSSIANLVPACAPCNADKGRMSAAAFRAKLSSDVEQAQSLERALRDSIMNIGEPQDSPNGD